MDTGAEFLSAPEMKRLRKKLRSPEAYAESRDVVVGPEKQGEQMKENASLAELRFALELEPVIRESLQKKIADDINQFGMDAVLSGTVGEEFDVRATEDGIAVTSGDDTVPLSQKFQTQYLEEFRAALDADEEDAE